MHCLDAASLQLQSSLEELAEDSLQAKMTAAQTEHDSAAAEVEKANSAVEAAQRELANIL